MSNTGDRDALDYAILAFVGALMVALLFLFGIPIGAIIAGTLSAIAAS